VALLGRRDLEADAGEVPGGQDDPPTTVRVPNMMAAIHTT